MISFSAIDKYLSCPYEYFLHYEENFRSTTLKSSLYFGKCFDEAMNILLKTRNLTLAKERFNDIFLDNKDVVYIEEDVDQELLSQEEFESNPAYYSLKKKGLVMLEGFHQEILPRIKRVIACQEERIIENEQKEKLKIIADLIIEWEDGSIILMDNKTSIMRYKEDSVQKSMQLAVYYYFLKEIYNIEKIGFFTFLKTLKKNRIKICQECGFDGSAGRHLSCPNKRNNGRCDGLWDITIKPEPYIQVLIDNPKPKFIEMTIDIISDVQYNVNNKIFYRNLKNCVRGKNYKCDFYDLCHNDSMMNLKKK